MKKTIVYWIILEIISPYETEQSEIESYDCIIPSGHGNKEYKQIMVSRIEKNSEGIKL